MTEDEFRTGAATVKQVTDAAVSNQAAALDILAKNEWHKTELYAQHLTAVLKGRLTSDRVWVSSHLMTTAAILVFLTLLAVRAHLL